MDLYKIKNTIFSGNVYITTDGFPIPQPEPVFSIPNTSLATQPPIPTAGDQFGRSLSFDGTTLIVGSPNREVGPLNNAGSAFIYEWDGTNFVFITEITAGPFAKASDNFGLSVSVDGDVIAVGAPLHESSQGAVYIFEKTGGVWPIIPSHELTETFPQSGDQFGFSISVSLKRIAIGSPGDDSIGFNRGSVSIFFKEGNNWNLEEKLTAGIDVQNGAEFGNFVSMKGAIIGVGAWRADSSTGAIYIIYRIGTKYRDPIKLTPPFPITSSRLGTSLEIGNKYVVAGAPYGGEGRAYVWKRLGEDWTFQAELSAKQSGGLVTDIQAAVNGQQGISVSLDEINGIIAVGAHRNQSNKGSIFLYENVYDEWGRPNMNSTRLEAADAGVGDFLGLPVAIKNGIVVAGASRKDTSPQFDTGAIYSFSNP